MSGESEYQNSPGSSTSIHVKHEIISDVESDSEECVRKHKCSFCKKSYSSSCALRRHVRDKHQDSLPQKKFLFPCYLCNRKNFNKKHHLVHHMRLEHGLPDPLVRLHECSMCSASYGKKDLHEHYIRDHKIVLISEDLTFPSFQAFLLWKEKIEQESFSKFVVERGAKKSGPIKHHYFVCNRSGKYHPKGKAEICIETQKSKKMDHLYSACNGPLVQLVRASCPAHLKVFERDDGLCSVTYIKTHVGHEPSYQNSNYKGFICKERFALPTVVMECDHL